MCQSAVIQPHDPIAHEAQHQLFYDSRTHSYWLDKPVAHELLHELYDMMKLGPTSANCSPARLVFVTSTAGKERLVPLMAEGNREKTKLAPVTVLVAYDTEFYEQLPKLLPQADARSWFVGKPALIEEAAFRNGSLQGGYLIMAARALGLDCGPMSGFDAEGINREFFADRKWKINFICNLGYGDPDKLHPRNPRLDFSEACLEV